MSATQLLLAWRFSEKETILGGEREAMDQNLKDILIVSLPTLMVLVGIFINRTDVSRLDGRITSLEDKIDGRIVSLEDKMDIRAVSLEDKVDSNLNRLSDKIDAAQNQFHNDVILLLSELKDQDRRITRLEERAG